jgi:hypothetical protein
MKLRPWDIDMVIELWESDIGIKSITCVENIYKILLKFQYN